MNFRKYFQSRRGELLTLLKQIVELESPTQAKARVDACSEFVVSRLRGLSGQIRRYPQSDTGDLYSCDILPGGEADSAPHFLLLLHTDTVCPLGRLAEKPFRVLGDRAYGPGALDMKAGIVMALSALKAIRDLNRTSRRPVRLFLDSCEETGSRAATETCRKLARGASAVLCLEPAIPGGALKLERKGRQVVELICRGRSAHAGSPEQGVSAVEELVSQLRGLKRLAKGGVTVNPGLISGGEAVNVVAKEASVWLDIRFRSKTQEDRFSEWFEDLRPILPGARVSHIVQGRIPPMEASAASRSFFRRARAKASEMGMELTWGRTGGGSDASLLSDLGLPILDGLGPDGKGIHAEDEHVLIPSLIDRTALLTEILLSF